MPKAQSDPFLATPGRQLSLGGFDTFTDGPVSLWAVYDAWNRPPGNGRYFCCRSVYLARRYAT